MTLDALAPWYLWTKSAHLVSVFAWMAGLFYLPRLYVYHVEQIAPGSPAEATFQTMERKLLRQIMNPAMVATWGFGLMLALLAAVSWALGTIATKRWPVAAPALTIAACAPTACRNAIPDEVRLP